jgi:hypothetical protein
LKEVPTPSPSRKRAGGKKGGASAVGEGGDTLLHTGPLWRWTTPAAPAAWYFVTIDGEAGEALSAIALMRRLEGGHKPGWGSLKVAVTVGESRWNTSVFPSRDLGWMLPVKAGVRKAEGLGEGDLVELVLEV